jgi:hypothetical protein
MRNFATLNYVKGEQICFVMILTGIVIGAVACGLR